MMLYNGRWLQGRDITSDDDVHVVRCSWVGFDIKPMTMCMVHVGCDCDGRGDATIAARC